MSTPDQPGTPPLTRKQLREQRNTGSTPIVPADGSAPDIEETAPPVAPLPRPAEPAPIPPAPVPDSSVDLGASPLTRRQARQQERIRTASVPVITPDLHPEPPVPAPVAAEPAAEERPTVNPDLGADLLAAEPAPAPVQFPPSFDQLIARGTAATGTVSSPNALILSQDPSAPTLGPLTATGEVLITGTFALPEGLGSTGHAPGVADGKEVDAVLVDGELPPSSSPTPIAASAAISTVKTAGEIIRPPAPERGSRLVLALAITAGALALALVGALIFAVSTGVFS